MNRKMLSTGLSSHHRVTKSGRHLTVLGALFLGASSLIHLRLWSSFGYRHIPVIGPLFLFQSFSFLLLAVALVIYPRRLTAAAGVFGAFTTIAAFLVSVSRGTFGFHEVWSDPFARCAFAVEVAAALVLAAAYTVLARTSPTHS